MKLIVGLGNPGKKYENTRHNIGFKIVDKICEILKVELNNIKFNGIFIKHDDVIIAKPLTYMNLSGNFIQSISNFYKIKPEDILVIHDDMDYDLGFYSIKTTGSGGGQNGMKDTISKLGTKNIPRLRIGIGRNMLSVDHVLGKFKQSEKVVANKIIAQGARIAIEFINKNAQQLMNEFNSKKGLL